MTRPRRAAKQAPYRSLRDSGGWEVCSSLILSQPWAPLETRAVRSRRLRRDGGRGRKIDVEVKVGRVEETVAGVRGCGAGV